MDATTTKDLLHLRIEQADEKLLAVLAQMTEILFRNYQSEVMENSPQEDRVPSWAKPLTAAESLADLREGLAAYEGGQYVTLEEARKEAATW